LKICSVKECNKESKAKGYCNSHYVQARINGLIGNPRKCSVGGCDLKEYAKGLCFNHRSMIIRKGTTDKYVAIKCPVEGCTKRPNNKNDVYCSYHAARIRRGVSLDAPREELSNRECKYNWNGGGTRNKFQSEISRQRTIRMTTVNHTCEVCGDIAVHVHHKDKNWKNNEQENLQALCARCHYAAHRKDKKYVRLYGLSLPEIAVKLDISKSHVCYLENLGKLKDRLQSHSR
jgi:hypothetical protein